jgi:hypothetical protein
MTYSTDWREYTMRMLDRLSAIGARFTLNVIFNLPLVLIYPVWNEGVSRDPERLFRPRLHSGELDNRPRRSGGSQLAEAAKARGSLHLWRQSHDQFLAWGPAQARGETPGALNARPRRSLRLPRLLRYGSFQSLAAGRLHGEGQANI